MDDIEIIVRWARLRDELKPVPIYAGDPPRPIDADWIAVTGASIPNDGRRAPLEGHVVYYLTDGGEILAVEQFDTIDIALDQVRGLAGFESLEFQESEIPLKGEGDRIQWSLIEQRTA